MSDSINNIKKIYKKRIKSDELAKLILSQRLPAIDFAKEYLPDDVKKIVNIDTIKVEKESYIEESLKKKYSDIVYSIKTIDNERETFVYVLLEMQSTPDYNIAFRLQKYTHLLLQRHLKKKQPLPLIVPMVVYHGTKKYTAPLSFWDMFDDPKLAKQLMGNQYKLIDLNSASDDEMQKRKNIGMLEYFLKHIQKRDILKIWEDALKRFKEIILIDKKNDYIYLRSFLYYTDDKVKNAQKDELKNLLFENLNKEQGEKLM